MGKIEEGSSGLHLEFLKNVQPNSFSKLTSVGCSFNFNARETCLFVTNL